MSRRGRNQGVPISLFSFQDIITSVTAIMILLVLILTLELITKMNSRGVATEDRQVAEDLQRTVATLRSRLVELRAQSADAEAAAMRIARSSPEELEAETRGAQRQSETLESDIAAIERQQKQAGRKRREAELDLLKAEQRTPELTRARAQALEDQRTADSLDEQNAEEEARQRKVELEITDPPQQVSTLVYNPTRGELLRPILAEVSADGITVLGDGEAGIESFGWGMVGPPARFVQWLHERDKTREYVVIMLRPSGLDKLEAVREAITAQGIDLGLELVSEEMDVVLAREQRNPL